MTPLSVAVPARADCLASHPCRCSSRQWRAKCRTGIAELRAAWPGALQIGIERLLARHDVRVGAGRVVSLGRADSRPVAVGGIALAAGRIDQHIVQEETVERRSRRGAGILAKVEQVIHIFRAPLYGPETWSKDQRARSGPCPPASVGDLRIRDRSARRDTRIKPPLMASTLLYQVQEAIFRRHKLSYRECSADVLKHACAHCRLGLDALE